MVSPAVLAAAVVQDPAADRRADVTAAATGATDEVWPAFAGNSLVPHALYVAHDGFLTLPHPRTIGVTLTFADPAARDAFAALPLEWGRWDGATWTPVQAAGSNAGETGWAVTFGDVPTPEPVQVAGRTARWLRARLRQAIGTVPGADRAVVQGVTVTADVTDAAPTPPTAAFSGAAPVDLAGDAYPFGEQPRFTDTFTVGSDVLGHPGAEVTLDVTISSGLPVPPAGSDGLTLLWEVGGADGWVPVGRSVPVGDPQGTGFADGTAALTTSGAVSFPVPATGAPLAIGGVSTWWLRVRIAAGNYGHAAGHRTAARPVAATRAGGGHVRATGRLGPPGRLGVLGCRAEPGDGDRRRRGRRGPDRQHRRFPPFRAVPGDRPVLHLGVDRPFPNRPVRCTCRWSRRTPIPAGRPRPPPRGSTRGAAGGPTSPPSTRPAGCTRRRPSVSSAPPTWCRRRCSGAPSAGSGCARAAAGPVVSLRLRRILPTPCPRVPRCRPPTEVLGVSDATAALTLRTTRTPVLAGERLEVLTAAEWQAWERTPDFAASGPHDHAYALDRERGEVFFGDGRHGAVPPAGSTVRATYRSGGGSAGNRPAGAVHPAGGRARRRGLGGQPRARRGRRRRRTARAGAGPGARRTAARGRAVAAEDYPDLAVAASPTSPGPSPSRAPINPLDVAWITPVPVDPAGTATDGPVLCSAPAADVATHRPEAAGRVTVAVVPESTDARPVPSRQLLDEVGDALRPRSPAVLGGDGLTVAGPAWIAADRPRDGRGDRHPAAAGTAARCGHRGAGPVPAPAARRPRGHRLDLRPHRRTAPTCSPSCPPFRAPTTWSRSTWRRPRPAAASRRRSRPGPWSGRGSTR